MKKITILISIIIFGTSCGKTHDVWTPEDWTPIMIVDGKNYWSYGPVDPDTLQSGEIFKAKLFMPLKKFEDSVGNQIDVKLEKVDFEILQDSIRLKFSKYASIVNDTAFVTLPVDTLIKEFKTNDLQWLASLWISNDTTYMISGDWHLKRNR